MYLIFAFLSAVSAAFVAIFGKIGLSKVDTTLATTLRAIIMALLLVVLTLIAKKWDLTHVDSKALAYIFLSAFAGAASWLFYFFALKFGPATSVAAIDRLSVVFVIILAAVFLGESLTIKSILGGILIVSGAFLLIK